MAPQGEADPSAAELTLGLAGDVMTGRGIDQILPHPGDPELHEGFIADARDYVRLAEERNGEVPAPVDPAYICGEGLTRLREHAPDAFIVNLETSVTTSEAFWPGKSVHYRMHPANVECLLAAGVDACTLANNHVLDFGAAGLTETLATLREAGIDTAGAGRNLGEALRPATILSGTETRVLVAALGSASSGIPSSWAASPSEPGIDLLPDLSEATARDVADRLQRHRRAGDIALVSIHWGSNWGYEVDPEMTRFAHALIDGGVDIVHGHSSHHIRPIEIYRGKLIVYGAGDLISDYEGIRGGEAWRSDLGAMFFPVVSARDGSLRSLQIAPLQTLRMRLIRPSDGDVEGFLATLNRISGGFGARFAQRRDGELLLREATGW